MTQNLTTKIQKLFSEVSLKVRCVFIPMFCMAVSALTAATKDNLLDNPGLEEPSGGQKVENWELVQTQGRLVQCSVDEETCHSGRRAVVLEAAEAVAGNYGEWRPSSLPRLEAGKTYRFAVWTKGSHLEGRPPYLEVYSFDKDGEPRLIAQAQTKLGDFDWKRIVCNFNVPKDSDRIRLGAGLSGGTGKVWFDDFWLGDAQGDQGPVDFGEKLTTKKF